MPTEHFRPGGQIAQGYYCCRCGAPGVNMYATGHGQGLCEANVPLVRELDRANQRINHPGRSLSEQSDFEADRERAYETDHGGRT